MTFDHFRYFGIGGPDFRELAPVLAERMYAHNIRSILVGLSAVELAEAVEIAQLAANSPPSPGLEAAERSDQAVRRCSPVPPGR